MCFHGNNVFRIVSMETQNVLVIFPNCYIMPLKIEMCSISVSMETVFGIDSVNVVQCTVHNTMCWILGIFHQWKHNFNICFHENKCFQHCFNNVSKCFQHTIVFDNVWPWHCSLLCFKFLVKMSAAYKYLDELLRKYVKCWCCD